MSGKTWLLIILIIVVLGVIVGIASGKDGKLVFISNSVDETKTNEVVNEVKTQNTIENRIIESTQENKTVETTPKETFTESPKSDGEKAIQIVKNNYGEGPNTEFEIANWDDGKGRVVVVVTDTTTTRNVFYHVNVSTGDFEIQY